MSDRTEQSDDRIVAPGERREALVARSFASLQSKVQNGLALGVVVLLGGAFLAWYYLGLAEKHAEAATPAKPKATQGEMRLPPLGPAPAKKPPPVVVTSENEAPVVSDVFGNGQEAAAFPNLAATSAAAPSTEPSEAAPATPDPDRQRRLDAPVLVHASTTNVGMSADASVARAGSGDAALDGGRRPGMGRPGAAGNETELATRLRPTVLAASAAAVLPERRFLLTKGAFLDCTLETGIDSTLPGMTTCVIATDVWSADGSTVLLERGTRLIGETRGGLQQGQARLFVLWSEARTPAGVAVELASPSTDALGRSGLPGEVNSHFGARFGAAILISLLDAGAAALVSAQGDGGDSVIVSSGGAHDVVSEVLKQTAGIAPTLSVPPGTRVQVLVARDVDFAPVYALVRR